jgi:mRNA interferase RelE/StbE
MLAAIRDRRVQQKIRERIDHLRQDAEKLGKPLGDELTGYRCLRAVGQRYRIIYRIDGARVIVSVVAVGLRREGSRDDIYVLARRLVKLGLLG